jgi:hypothetical protein
LLTYRIIKEIWNAARELARFSAPFFSVAPMGRAASASQMGRFETEWLTRPVNLAALADLPGQWIDAVHQRRQPRVVRDAVRGSVARARWGCPARFASRSAS